MADAAVAFALKKFDDLVLNQIDFHTDIHKQVKRIKDELEWMHSFLKDAKLERDNRMCLVSQVRDAAYDVEDLIDTYFLKIHSPKKQHPLKKIISSLQDRKPRSNIANHLKGIQETLEAISDSRARYGNIGEGKRTINAALTAARTKTSSSRGENRHIVGMEDDIEKLKNQLVDTEDCWRAVSIVGMAGIGKTTLARKVYHHPYIKGRFYCRAWIHVSQEFNVSQVNNTLKRIIRQIPSASKEFEELEDEELLRGFLHENLLKMRYLVVLDDMWSTEQWDFLANAFPCRDNGSRLLLTTRNNEVAKYVDSQTVPYAMQFLSEADSWQLFCRNAFDGENDTYRSSLLEEIGREIVKRCGGLPLAITVSGGLLSRERRVEHWKRVLNHMYSQFSKEPAGVSEILALSYNDLPYNLKSCFLYLGHFPEDYLIPTRKLFRLWVSEGLISDQEESMEVEAEDYLEKLIQRNMVQIERKSAYGRVERCRLHNLLRELAISKAKEENFLEIPVNETFTPSDRCRRHSIYYEFHLSSLKRFKPKIRSLLFFNVCNCVRGRYTHFIGGNHCGFSNLSDSNLSYISKNFKLLRTLELEGLSCRNIPSKIGKLIHLKYLGLRATNIKELPSTLGSLRNLQTLDIAGNLHLQVVTNVIKDMKNLRHLYISGQQHGGFLRVDMLSHLQTLSEIRVDSWKKNNSGQLSTLRKLGIRGDLSSETTEIFDSIAKLSNLCSLYLHAEVDGFPLLADRLVALHSLTKLHLSGQITQLPRSQEFPPVLLRLILERTRLEQGSISILENLPRLEILILTEGSYSNESLAISVNGFPRLKFLQFKDLASLQELNIGEGAVPMLKIFQIVNCNSLRQIVPEARREMIQFL